MPAAHARHERTPDGPERSPLALLHPDGCALAPGDVIVVDGGTARPERLLGELQPDGIAYLRLDRRRRTALARAAGLELGPELLEAGGLLVPVEREAVRWALGERPPSRRAELARFLPLTAMRGIARGAIARRPGGRRYADWLRSRAEGAAVVAAPGGRAFLVGKGGVVVLAARTEPDDGGTRAGAERAALVMLGATARAAGAAVPVPLDEPEAARTPCLVTTGIRGRPAALLIERRPRRRAEIVDRVAAWLERWNAASAVEEELSSDVLERRLLAPAAALGLQSDYLAALGRLCNAAAGRRVKLVATHNDLTTANVLVGGRSALGIVDWEAAEQDGLPLVDLLYALADAEAAATGFADRPAAFLTSVGTHDSPLEHRARRVLGLDDVIADVCFHACWLGHALNEKRAAADGAQPFGEIARTIAQRELRLGAVE